MKKNLLLVLMAITAALCCALGLTACGDKSSGHTHDYDTEWSTSPTQHWHECKNDGCDEKKIDAANHVDENGDGICDVCDYVVGHVHNLIEYPANSASCDRDGNSGYYVCESCGKWYSDKNGTVEIEDHASVVIPKSHILTFMPENSATCTDDGNIAYYVCDDCGKWFEDDGATIEIEDHSSVIITKGHNLTYVPATSATCTDDGNTAYFVCEDCGKWFEYDDATIEIEDHSDVVIAHSHNLYHNPSNPATCNSDGNTEYYSCMDCGKWFEDQDATTEIEDHLSVVIPKEHHLTFTPANPATCTNWGNIAYYTCDVCGKWFEDENGTVEIENHEDVNLAPRHTLTLVPATPATCTDDGNIAYYVCDDCGNWFEDDGKTEIYFHESVIIPKSHTYENGVCTVCGALQPTEGLLYANRGNYSEVVSMGTATATEIVIADEYEGLPVTTIGYSAFSAYTNITSINIPETVTTIGYSAFAGCSGLAGKFEIPGSIVTIDDRAFWECMGLTSISIPESVTSIGYQVFTNCTALESITVDENNEYYSSYGGILYNKTQTEFVGIPFAITVLDENNIPDSITCIDTETFAGSSLISVTLPESVTLIKSYAFANCENLTSVTLPTSIETIYSDAFYNSYVESATVPAHALQYVKNSALKNLVITSGESIADSALRGYSNLESVQFPEGLTSIGKNAFYECTGLTSVELPEGLETIDEYAFYGCSNLESVTLHKGLKNIKLLAFKGCGKLTDISLPEGLESIGEEAFESTGLMSITIPDSVIDIGLLTFYLCAIETANTPAAAIGAFIHNKNTLKTVTITSGECIGADDDFYVSQAFSGFTNLQTVIICEGVKIIGNTAFSNCTALTDLTLPEGIDIRKNAFSGCTNLVSVQFPENISIGEDAFYECGLTSITIPDSVTEVGVEAFYKCPIETATLPAAAVIGLVANSQLKSVVITSGESLRENAFYGGINTSVYPNLESVTLPEGLTSIGDKAFYNCPALKYINLPDSLTSIGQYAFEDCTSLTNIVIPDEITTIAHGTFWGCTGLTSVIIPESVTQIEDAAFNFCTNFIVYYKGTAEDWANIEIGDVSGSYIKNATRYYYSETEPELAGSYWHYVTGEPTLWYEDN